MSDSSAPSPSLVRNLEPLMQGGEERVTLQDIIDRAEGAQGLAPIVFVLTLPVLLPLPPGVSMIIAVPLLLTAPQMLLGRTDLWMPQKLAGQSVARDKLQKTFRRILPWIGRIEGFAHPRLTFLTGRTGAAVVGLACTLMAMVLILPLPFANLAPALTVCLLSLGVARRDGLMVLAGFALLALAVVLVVWGLHGARLGLHALMRWI